MHRQEKMAKKSIKIKISYLNLQTGWSDFVFQFLDLLQDTDVHVHGLFFYTPGLDGVLRDLILLQLRDVDYSD